MEQLMTKLNAAAAGSTLRHRLYEARFLTTLRGAGPQLVTLIYHRKLGPGWEEEARLLSSALGCSIVGRSRGQKIVVGQDWVEEELRVSAAPIGRESTQESRAETAHADETTGQASSGSVFRYRHAENGFSQPNGAVCEKMLDFALSCTAGKSLGSSDLLELYCGNCNFTAPLARHRFRRVLATEISGPSVELARHNLRANGCTNATVVRASAEEVASALQAGAAQLESLVAARLSEGEGAAPDTVLRLGQGAQGAGAEGAGAASPPPSSVQLRQLRTLLVDPPRSGLDPVIIEMARRHFRWVIYISCNTCSMLRDIEALAEGRELTLHHFA
jgi:tRNA (uracil-5-)-methyltransferase